MKTPFSVFSKSWHLLLIVFSFYNLKAQTASISNHSLSSFVIQIEQQTEAYSTNLLMDIQYRNGSTETVSIEDLNQKEKSCWERSFTKPIQSIQFRGFLKSEDPFTPQKPIFHKNILMDTSWKSYQVKFGGTFGRPYASGGYEKTKV